jgi:D-threonine aldolase
MNPQYAIQDTSAIYSPALVFYKDLIRRNIARIVEIAGSPARLRPHVKTHKTREIARLEQEAGITKQKCATIAEAEMLAGCGVQDILLAYPLVGPNCGRLARLLKAFPACKFAVVADHPLAAQALSAAMTAGGVSVDVLIDLDVGQHRTGIPAGPEAASLYETIGKLPGLRPSGFHVYDGHNHQESLPERAAAVKQLLAPVLELRATLEKKGLPVPAIVGGGTPTFPVWAKLDIPGLECSPGTCVLHDHGYGSHFADMNFTPAALLLTRVISKPTPTRLTLDLGYKAVASDPPALQRVVLLNVPDYQTVLQNEEHLVVETPAAAKFAPGAEVFAVPYHICPTCALHKQAYVVENGKLVGQWDIVGRDRVLTI